MKKAFVFLLIILSCFSGISKAASPDHKVLVIVDLTMTKLKNIHYLVSTGIINVPGLKIIALYNSNEKYDFSQCIKYVRENKLNYIEYKGLNMNIDYDSLYCNNSLTPVFLKIFNGSDAILFMGGDDIPPLVYHEKTKLTTEILPFERMYELSFMFHLIGSSSNPSFKPFLEQRPSYPVIGICLGMQNMNVSSGGTLYQDIPSEIYGMKNFEETVALPANIQHRNYWGNISDKEDFAFFTFHPIIVVPNSFYIKKIAFVPSDNDMVLSAHHQCVNKTGLNMIVAATSVDGKVIEAIENTYYPNVFGVQYHPEYQFIYDNSCKSKMSGLKDGKTADTILPEPAKEFNKAFWKYFSMLLNSAK